MEVRTHTAEDRNALRWAMTLSLVVGVLMFAIKVGAYLLTGSAAILSDAAESVVHVAAVAFAAYSLRISFKPADDSHLYGHAKIAFFSAGFEGGMITLAAFYIIYESLRKWIGGLALENLGLGTLLTGAAMLINGGLGAYLLVVGRRRKSIILEANGRHVLTDCWTSAAVIVGLCLAIITGWLPWDPICGIAVACNILFTGFGLIRSALKGLMDVADPGIRERIIEILDRETAKRGIGYHELRHRNLGHGHWVEVHLVFPANALLREAHRAATAIERVVERSVEPRAYLTTHLECASDHDELHPDEPSISPELNAGVGSETRGSG